MANGRVIVGFSYPMIGRYSNAGTAVSYTDVIPMARGVGVDFSLNEPTESTFYADDAAAETAPAVFAGGTVNLEVDGLKPEARAMVDGLPAATSLTVGSDKVDVYAHGDNAKPPYLGVGFVIQYQEDGVNTWEPVLLTKTRFKPGAAAARTKGETTEFQTETRNATLMRDDTTEHNWKKVGAAQTTAEQAQAVLRAMFGVTV